MEFLSAKTITDTQIDLFLCAVSLLMAAMCYLLIYCLLKSASMNSQWKEMSLDDDNNPVWGSSPPRPTYRQTHHQTHQQDEQDLLNELNAIHREMNSNVKV